MGRWDFKFRAVKHTLEKVEVTQPFLRTGRCRQNRSPLAHTCSEEYENYVFRNPTLIKARTGQMEG